MKKNNNKGFTLAELLIVVAIIAVLVAIAIPIFTNQLEKSREAVDFSNARSYYAEIASAILTGDLAKANDTTTVAGQYTAKLTADLPSAADGMTTVTVTVPRNQSVDKWQSASEIAGVKIAVGEAFPVTADNVTITYTFKMAADYDIYLSAISWAAGA